MTNQRVHGSTAPAAPTIAIIGGGIGGLALAQGLHRQGITVEVYERDRTPADRAQGYRVHVNPYGAAALHELLPPHLWKTFLETTGTGAQGFEMLTERMKTLVTVDVAPENDPTQAHHSVSRITLRQVLLNGLDDNVHLGKTFTRYEKRSDGRFVCHFSDGTTALADVIVGADGTNSRVRAQYLPHAQRLDTGIRAIAGKYLLTPESRRRVDARLHRTSAVVLPPAGCGMFVAPHIYDDDSELRVDGIGSTDRDVSTYDNTSSYLLWAFAAVGDRFPADTDLAGLDGPALQDLLVGMIERWHPDLRTLVTEADPDTVTVLPIRMSEPIPRWTPSKVTLLGDAIHAMTPMRGIGANTALRDARVLCRQLASAHRGDAEIITAIDNYEAEMTEYGFDAVRSSQRSATKFVGENRFARAAFKTFLRTVQSCPPLKRKVFAKLGL
ncbi:FAD-dependent oxidoreductase [Streptomyces sp. 8N616]|uniref:FAD-dependent oxidoreductase n=1 Tax=Streptomyces sp. 8N616 TaxID=3457414 RepID=UPI003FD43ABE